MNFAGREVHPGRARAVAGCTRGASGRRCGTQGATSYPTSSIKPLGTSGGTSAVRHGTERARTVRTSYTVIPMWFDDLGPGKTWASLWSGYTLCGSCSGIRTVHDPCAGCGSPRIALEGPSFRVEIIDGREIRVPAAIFAGAEGRYEDWVYLQVMEREWKRPVTEDERVSVPGHPSPRAAIVLLFWTYFETRIGRLLRQSIHGVPSALIDDTMKRYSRIGARLHHLYRVLFGTTYFDDLTQLGFSDVASFLREVHTKRNHFAHGTPSAITDDLVSAVVERLKREHEAWIAVFNKRAAHLDGGRDHQGS